MLDVLDLDALGPPDEHGVRVRRVDEVGDLDAELTRLLDVLVRRVDEHREVVQQRALRVAGLARVELDVRAADLHARRARGARRGGEKPSARTRAAVCSGRAREQRGVVEVVLDVGRRLDEAEPQLFVDVEVRLPLARLLDLDALEAAQRVVEARDPQRDVLERAALARPLRLEQRQLPAPRVGADEREAVRPLDHVHAEAGGDEVGDRVAIRDPERDVVERLAAYTRRELTDGLLPGGRPPAGAAACSSSSGPRRFSRLASL